MLKLFTKTWKNDLPWIDLAFKSVSHFCKEPVDWVVAIEPSDIPELNEAIIRLRLWNHNHQIGFRMINSDELWPETRGMDGYFAQQWIKMNAHKVIGSESYWNWDSDVIAQKPFSSTDFLGKSGRPVYWFSHFNTLMAGNGADNPAHNQRRAVMKQIFRFEDISFEFMRCMPILLNGGILEHGSRNRIWNESLDKIIRSDRSFSEFNIYGQFAHFFFPDCYEWKNAEAQGPTWSGGYKEGGHGSGDLDGISIITQCHSWSGIPDHIRNYVNGLNTL